jgi:hypothetical protein
MLIRTWGWWRAHKIGLVDTPCLSPHAFHAGANIIASWANIANRKNAHSDCKNKLRDVHRGMKKDTIVSAFIVLLLGSRCRDC